MTFAPATLAYAAACVLVAGILRGFAGFGFALLAITLLVLVLDPAEVVPAVFLMEIAAGIHLLPGLWHDIRWRSIGWLLAGAVVATPIGVTLLSTVPAAPMKLALAVFVLAACAMLLRGYEFRSVPGPAATFATGAAAGLANGAFGIGGPPVILFYLSSPAAATAGRASIVAAFLGIDLIAVPMLAAAGLVGRSSFVLFAVFLPALLTGVWLGRQFAQRLDPDRLRSALILTLMAVAIAMLGATLRGSTAELAGG